MTIDCHAIRQLADARNDGLGKLAKCKTRNIMANDMAFRYPLNDKVETYEDDFHFWYVNGFHPDPKLKEEIVEEKPKETSEGKPPTINHFRPRVKARARGGWYR